MTQYLVWWLDQGASTWVYEEMEMGALSLPEYIAREARDRCGRAGRGRLWVPREIPIDEIEFLEDSPAARWITPQCAGGIVFHVKDYDKVKGLPGLITDTSLNIVQE